MPITQERMLAVLEVAHSLIERAQQTQSLAVREAQEAHRRALSLSIAYTNLIIAVDAAKPTPEEIVLISAERAHFRIVAKKNTRERERLQRKSSRGERRTPRGLMALAANASRTILDPQVFNDETPLGEEALIDLASQGPQVPAYKPDPSRPLTSDELAVIEELKKMGFQTKERP